MYRFWFVTHATYAALNYQKFSLFCIAFSAAMCVLIYGASFLVTKWMRTTDDEILKIPSTTRKS